ncbi:unnamed protein product [Vitrella brassicaformis CCMP3155]|uniref:Uncharacterized protein n=1 Tax=Vitrella brassicaformis (strain CCMP3155) TaxID=1169540 RepID=A0A0G4GDU1_VITBC|nr:unnamed protein product [Vitrella brassicaformis CCMP3155]|mmetsp:Transcript_24042/g.69282  ORF Transcript_24042/g.69282 Transcript_24042/m.69282 type:complete len:301 (+) Transcript_24042:58-960(+)|eukprot:CEM27534.1 unnamed protein product [Vitrella brassicaformis CCMP3155]
MCVAPILFAAVLVVYVVECVKVYPRFEEQYFVRRGASRNTFFHYPVRQGTVPCYCVQTPAKEYTFILSSGPLFRSTLSNRNASWSCTTKGGGKTVCAFVTTQRVVDRPVCVEGMRTVGASSRGSVVVESLESPFIFAMRTRQEEDRLPHNKCVTGQMSFMTRLTGRFGWERQTFTYEMEYEASDREKADTAKQQEYVTKFYWLLNRLLKDDVVVVLDGYTFDGHDSWRIQITYYAPMRGVGRGFAKRVSRSPRQVFAAVLRKTRPSRRRRRKPRGGPTASYDIVEALVQPMGEAAAPLEG